MNNYTYRARVIKVVDGDTIDCECDLPFYLKATQRFRLLGIDAPEMRGESREAGIRSKEYLKGLVEGKTCLLTSYKADSFGRWLADCMLTAELSGIDISDLSQHLIQAGYAKKYER